NFLSAEVVDAGNCAVTVALVNQGGVRLTKALAGPLPGRGSPLTVGVRPEHFVEAGQGAADLSVRIDVIEHLGSTSYVYANAAGEQLIVERDEQRRKGGSDSLAVAIPADAALLFDGSGSRLR